MLLIGLTGSIATGKSTVSSLLSQPPYSLPIIDADLLARKVVEPGQPAYRKIVSYFGPSTPDLLQPTTAALPNDGHKGKGRPLDRAALGRRVFGKSEAIEKDRKVLNSIVHPAVRKEMYSAMLKAYLRGCWAVVLDIPLLFESSLDTICGTTVVVGVRDPDVQLQRLLARDRDQGGSMTEEEARNRVASQGDVKSKVARVGFRTPGWGEVVWNDGDKQQLHNEIHRVMTKIKATSPSWWSNLLWICPPLALLAAIRAYLWAKRARANYEESMKKEKARL